MEPAPGGLTEARAGRLQAGGALREDALYVERAADAELNESLAAGELCAVVAPFQMGKSSLRRRAERKLERRGVRCLSVDLGVIGCSGVSPEEWFYALAFHLAEQSGAALDLLSFWRAAAGLTPARRFTRFLAEELFPEVRAPVAVFVDELDVALSLPFESEAFFTALREAHEARGRAGASLRVPFCLLGTTPPERWGRDEGRPPCAVDRVIRPQAFTREEGASLLPGLRAAGGDAPALLDAVLAATCGHPYRMQRLCELLGEEGHGVDASPRARVARLVESGALEPATSLANPA